MTSCNILSIDLGVFSSSIGFIFATIQKNGLTCIMYLNKNYSNYCQSLLMLFLRVNCNISQQIELL
jgi:hypothetical protein